MSIIDGHELDDLREKAAKWDALNAAVPCTEAVYSLARKLLWIAYVWNDHNFDHPHKIARKLAQDFGIESFDQANAWLSEQAKLIDSSPKGGSDTTSQELARAAKALADAHGEIAFRVGARQYVTHELMLDADDKLKNLREALKATSAEVGA